MTNKVVSVGIVQIRSRMRMSMGMYIFPP